MKKLLIKTLTGVAIAASVLGYSTRASAVPTMTIDNGIDPIITIVDNGSGDSSSLDGVVHFNGTLGQWSLVVTVGQTKPFLGSASAPHMDLGYVVTSTGAGTITIRWSDTDFTSSGGFAAEIGGTTAGNVAFDTYADSANLLFGTGIHLTSQTFSTSPFDGIASAGSVGTIPFSLTEQLVVTHGDGNISDSGNAALITTVPDGGATVTLMLGAFTGLGLMGTVLKRRTV